MKTLQHMVVLGMCLLLVGGCSEKTKVETKEALKETGEAVGAAAEDTKANIKKGAEAVKSGVDKAKEELSEEPASPPGDDADADSVPESQETEPQETEP